MLVKAGRNVYFENRYVRDISALSRATTEHHIHIHTKFIFITKPMVAVH